MLGLLFIKKIETVTGEVMHVRMEIRTINSKAPDSPTGTGNQVNITWKQP